MMVETSEMTRRLPRRKPGNDVSFILLVGLIITTCFT